MKVREIQASSIISESNLPDADYTINPYVGCMHSCLYCYARFMKKFTGHTEPWGEFVDVKKNAPDLIPVETDKYKGESVFLSSVTDPYLPLEKKYRLTRQILTKLIPLQPNLGIQTKSDLVLRDIDLLKQFENCEVGFTITTLDHNLRQEVEPLPSSAPSRIAALEKLKEAGIKNYVFIGPILPHLTDWKKIVAATRQFCDLYMFENLNVSGRVWDSVKQWLTEKHPALLDKYKEIYFSESDYWGGVEGKIRQFCEEEGIEYRVYFHHNSE